jgi:hypothetical protein
MSRASDRREAKPDPADAEAGAAELAEIAQTQQVHPVILWTLRFANTETPHNLQVSSHFSGLIGVPSQSADGGSTAEIGR